MRTQKTHWFLLLDRSSSMGSGFSTAVDSTEAKEAGNYNRKIDAAKDQAARAVGSIRDGDSVTLLAFSDNATVLTPQPISDESVAADVVSEVEPSGSTNVAAALDLALDMASELRLTRDYRYVNVLLISDGLSNVGDPVVSARRAADADLRISTVLIDPTEDGRALAGNISIGGGMHLVGSTKHIEHALETERVSHERRMARDRSLVTFAALAASITALLSAISGGVAFRVLDDVVVGASVFGAVAMLLTAVYLPFRYFAREEYLGIYTSFNSTERQTKKRFIYAPWKRISAVCGSVVLLLLAAAVFLNAVAIHQRHKEATMASPARSNGPSSEEVRQQITRRPFPTGAWTVRYATSQDREVLHLAGMRIDFEDTIVRSSASLFPECNDDREYQLTIDDSIVPARIDLTWGNGDAGEQRLGIVKWTDRTITMLLSESADSKRPVSFEAEDGSLLLCLERKQIGTMPDQALDRSGRSGGTQVHR